VDALGSSLIVVGSLQFGGVVVLGKIVTDGGPASARLPCDPVRGDGARRNSPLLLTEIPWVSQPVPL